MQPKRCTARITLKTDYTQWTWEQLNFEWMRKEKTTKKKKKTQNYVLSLIWGTFSRRKKKKKTCHPKCIFTLQLVAARLHDQAATSKEIQRASEILSSVGLHFFSSRAVAFDNTLILTHEVGK